MPLRHIKRLCIRSFQLLANLNRHVLVCDNVIQPCACFHHRILHQDTVSDLCALCDLNASEENTVLHIAFDHVAEEVAKEKLGLVNPDEILLKPNQ